MFPPESVANRRVTRLSHVRFKRKKSESALAKFTIVDISKIDLDRKTQLRCNMNEDIIETYEEDLRRGDLFPPIILFRDKDEYYIGDGFHRVEAAMRASRKVIDSKIEPGGFKEALIYAAGANDKMGFQRTRKDKRNAVTLLLKDPEICKIARGARKEG